MNLSSFSEETSKEAHVSGGLSQLVGQLPFNLQLESSIQCKGDSCVDDARVVRRLDLSIQELSWEVFQLPFAPALLPKLTEVRDVPHLTLILICVQF